MKDKLEKHHLSKAYFFRRKLFIVLSIIIGLGATLMVPIGVTLYAQSHISQGAK